MDDLAFKFKSAISEISTLLEQEGVIKRPHAATTGFHSLSQTSQQAALANVLRQREQMELLRPEIRDFERLKLICRFHNLTPVDEQVFNKIDDQHPWEIVDFHLNQLYRSKKVFELGHYAIEEYETYTPWQLFRRPQHVLNELAEITHRLKQADQIIDLSFMKPYIIEETLSTERGKYEITHDFACPLVDVKTGEYRAFVSAFKIRPIDDSKKNVVLFN